MFAEDLTPFFDLDGFADLAEGFGAHGQAVSFPVIFDAPAVVASVAACGMATSQPSVTTPTANIIEDWSGWELAINGKTYTVAAHEPDGTGISRLLLEAA